MLNNHPMVAFLVTTNADRTRSFYEAALGLEFVSDDMFALVMRGNGTTLRIAKVKAVVPVPYTSLGWDVPDVGQAVATLAERGVTFVRFPGMEQDAAGVWTVPGGAARVAWFRDPDGHLLSLSGQ